jgi:tetratricopeptide (TPR) repeat protein
VEVQRAIERSADGLADIALYLGDLSTAAAILEKGIAADEANKGFDSAAMKRLALSSVRIDQGRAAEALPLADRAVTGSSREETLFSAAQVYLRARKQEKARSLAETLGARLEPEARSYAKLVDGLLALEQGNPSGAIAWL